MERDLDWIVAVGDAVIASHQQAVPNGGVENYLRIHKSIRFTLGMEAVITKKQWAVEDNVELGDNIR